jgi:hypothetical protein
LQCGLARDLRALDAGPLLLGRALLLHAGLLLGALPVTLPVRCAGLRCCAGLVRLRRLTRWSLI